MARQVHPSLDHERFHDNLTRLADPVVAAVADARPDAVTIVTEALFDSLLELTARGLAGAGSRVPALDRCFTELMPSAPHLLAAEPRRVVTALVNAAHTIAERGGSIASWIERMATVGKRLSGVTSWLATGRVLAWRSGLAELRTVALETCDQLDQEVASLALGVDRLVPGMTIESVLDELRRDPWRTPAQIATRQSVPKGLRVTAAIGGFVGVGGPFAHPPRLTLRGDRIVVGDGSERYELWADIFGAGFAPSDYQLPMGAAKRQGEFEITRAGRVRHRDHERMFPAFANAASVAGTDRTLAVTMAYSHCVYVIAAIQGSAE